VGQGWDAASAEARPAGARQGLQCVALAAGMRGCGDGHAGVWERCRSSTEQACASLPKVRLRAFGVGRAAWDRRPGAGWRQARRRGWHTARSPASGAR